MSLAAPSANERATNALGKAASADGMEDDDAENVQVCVRYVEHPHAHPLSSCASFRSCQPPFLATHTHRPLWTSCDPVFQNELRIWLEMVVSVDRWALRGWMWVSGWASCGTNIMNINNSRCFLLPPIAHTVSFCPTMLFCRRARRLRPSSTPV